MLGGNMNADMTAPSDQQTEREDPYPRRFAVLKRSLLAAAIVVALVAGLRWWWGYEAQRRLDAFVNESHAAGRKVLIDDYATAQIQDSDNAAILLKRAYSQVKLTREQSDWESAYQSDLPLSGEDLQTIAEIQRANRSVYQDVREARDRQQADWGIRLRSPVAMVLLPHLNWVRRVEEMLAYTARYEHACGNDREAMELTRDMLCQARALEEGPDFLITHLVAMGSRRNAAKLVLEMAADLSIATPGADSGKQAQREQVYAIIGELLNEKATLASITCAWQAEQMAQLDEAHDFANARGRDATLRKFFEPMFVLEAIENARIASQTERAMLASNYPEGSAIVSKRQPTTASALYNTSRIMGGRYSMALGGRMRFDFANRAMCRGTAVALALRLYALDHGGHYPRTLAELTPRYLPEAPLDPFSRGQPLRYRFDAASPVVYSVGENGIDDGGVEFAANDKVRRRGSELDLVCSLRRSASGAATRPAREE